MSQAHDHISKDSGGRAARAGARRRAGAVATALATAALLATAAALGAAAPSIAVTHTLKPGASTGKVTHVRGVSVTLLGKVDPNGSETTYVFQYGPTISYGSQTPSVKVGSGMVAVKVGQNITRFLPGYHYRIVATNRFGTTLGKDRIYTPKVTALHFVLPKRPHPVIYGGTFVLSGSLVGVAAGHHQVALQANPYPYLSGFAQVGTPVFTDSAGRFTLRAPKMLISTQFRVTTLDLKPLPSGVIKERVALQVKFKVHASSHAGIVRMYGTVSPAAAVGAHVLFQVQKARKHTSKQSEKAEELAEERGESPSVHFATQAAATVKRATHSFARFSLIVRVRTSGHYRALVVPRNGAYSAGASSTITVHAPPTRKRR